MELLLTILFSFIGFVISLMIASWIFEFPLLIRHSRAQTKLLSKIAEQQGVADYVIKNILEATKDKKVK